MQAGAVWGCEVVCRLLMDDVEEEIPTANCDGAAKLNATSEAVVCCVHMCVHMCVHIAA